jgi:hypothetical protein
MPGRDGNLSPSYPFVVLPRSLNQLTPPTLPLYQTKLTYIRTINLSTRSRSRTIAVRALLFLRQILINVTPLQLAQNGLYCKPPSGLGESVYWFACGSINLLYTFQKNLIEEIQQLYVTNCIWQIIGSDLKPTFERPNIVTH